MPKMTAQDLRLDYFKFYDLENRVAEGAVSLQGQFDKRPQRMQVTLLDFFANAVSKNGEPFYDRNAHLAWYRGVQPAEPTRQVLVENQFGRVTIRIGKGYGLLVPTHKVEPGSAFPERLDHYKVYRLAEPVKVPSRVIKLKDQFVGEAVTLGLPLFFAVPVKKRHGQQTFEIHNDLAHLLIYSITPRDIAKSIRLRNQFAPGVAGRVVRSLMLGAPSLKREWKQV